MATTYDTSNMTNMEIYQLAYGIDRCPQCNDKLFRYDDISRGYLHVKCGKFKGVRKNNTSKSKTASIVSDPCGFEQSYKYQITIIETKKQKHEYTSLSWEETECQRAKGLLARVAVTPTRTIIDQLNQLAEKIKLNPFDPKKDDLKSFIRVFSTYLEYYEALHLKQKNENNWKLQYLYQKHPFLKSMNVSQLREKMPKLYPLTINKKRKGKRVWFVPKELKSYVRTKLVRPGYTLSQHITTSLNTDQEIECKNTIISYVRTQNKHNTRPRLRNDRKNEDDDDDDDDEDEEDKEDKEDKEDDDDNSSNRSDNDDSGTEYEYDVDDVDGLDGEINSTLVTKSAKYDSLHDENEDNEYNGDDGDDGDDNESSGSYDYD